jgi:Mrp family chromosome partitioning ATPase
VYQQLLGQAQQAGGATGKAINEMPDVRVLSGAVPSAFPSAPNMKMAGGLGLVGGGILGCLLAFVRVQREDGFSDAETLAAVAGLPVAITLPRAGRGTLLTRVAVAPGGPEAEALRLLRVRLRALAHAPRSVTFTAIGDDPALIASAFARVVAGDGEHVLLAEGDLGDPSVGDLLGIPDGEFDRALRGDEDWRDVTRADPDTPLDVLASNQPAEDGHTLLTGVALQNLLMEARDDYSLIVFPSADVDDATTRTLAQRTDATILVVNARRARRANVREQTERLSTLSRNPVLGVLVTQA